MNNDEPFFPLKRWDTSSSKKPDNNPAVFIMKNDEIIILKENYTVVHYMDTLPEYWHCLIPFRCLTCNNIQILTTTVDRTGGDTRSQGAETYFTSQELFNCNQCNQEISADIFITHYVSNWFCEVDCFEALPIWVDGFSWICEELKKLELAKMEISYLKHQKISLSEHIKRLIEKDASRSSFILLVEGPDDPGIWKQWLIKEGVDHSQVSIIKYGSGGKDEAIKAAKFFRYPGLKSIPHKAILDSDGKRDELIERLTKEEKLEKNSFHVLERKEIESYLIEPHAIGTILDREVDEVETFTSKLSGGDGKEKLEKIFKFFEGPKVSREIKETIAIHLQNIPYEIKNIIQEIGNHTNQESFSEELDNDDC